LFIDQEKVPEGTFGDRTGREKWIVIGICIKAYGNFICAITAL
jgi:hypothetical protein